MCLVQTSTVQLKPQSNIRWKVFSRNFVGYYYSPCRGSGPYLVGKQYVAFSRLIYPNSDGFHCFLTRKAARLYKRYLERTGIGAKIEYRTDICKVKVEGFCRSGETPFIPHYLPTETYRYMTILK